MRIVLLFLLITVLASCNKQGVDANELEGSTWEIYQYKDPTSTNPIALNDTLTFNSHKAYTYNLIPDQYSLTSSANQKVLSLYGSKFGDISGRISSDFNKYGEILGVTFSTMNTSDNQSSYILWIKRVQ